MSRLTTFDVINQICPKADCTGHVTKPIRIKSYAMWCRGKGRKTWYEYCEYVQRMKEKDDYIPNQKDIFDIIIKHCYSLEYELARQKHNEHKEIMKYVDRAASLRKYEDFYHRFKKYLKSKIATSLNLPVSDITDGLFHLELKKAEIIQQYNL